jgi:DNA-binding NarL/FixJ family response regulator
VALLCTGLRHPSEAKPPELLIEAIHKVVAGKTWIDQRCIQALVQAVAAEDSQTRRNELTERDSNKEIAASLDISEAAVKSALQQLFRKTSARTRSQLVRVALEEYGSVWALRQ